MNRSSHISTLLLALTLGLVGCAGQPRSAQQDSPAVAKAASVPPQEARQAEASKPPVSEQKVAEAMPAPAEAVTPAARLEVNITAELPTVEVLHDGKLVTIMRNQNGDNKINPHFAKTSRKCPPFCIQPYEIAPGVKTIGELDMLAYMKKAQHDPSIVIVDSRTPDWLERGTIPGAINIPWDKLNIGKSDPFTVQDILTRHFGAVEREGFWDFDQAKTLVLFCNGPWCGQSPTNIKGLLRIGYPASKLVWYRGGMQEWETMGLTTVKPAGAKTADAGTK
jgi:rhodanese-related sulfurtransferase